MQGGSARIEADRVGDPDVVGEGRLELRGFGAEAPPAGAEDFRDGVDLRLGATGFEHGNHAHDSLAARGGMGRSREPVGPTCSAWYHSIVFRDPEDDRVVPRGARRTDRFPGTAHATPGRKGIVSVIPVFKPSCSEAEIDAVAEVLRSGWGGLGPKTAEFETAFANYIGVADSVGLNSGTAALHLGLMALDVKGGEVVTTPMTFVSTNHAILYNRATPVLCDVEADTMNIDPGWVERSVSERTRAIVVVHYGGHPVDLEAIRRIAAPRGIPVLEDAAHACGARYKGVPVGRGADLACFSFHAVKNLAMGGGGAVVARDPALV